MISFLPRLDRLKSKWTYQRQATLLQEHLLPLPPLQEHLPLLQQQKWRRINGDEVQTRTRFGGKRLTVDKFKWFGFGVETLQGCIDTSIAVLVLT